MASIYYRDVACAGEGLWRVPHMKQKIVSFRNACLSPFLCLWCRVTVWSLYGVFCFVFCS